MSSSQSFDPEVALYIQRLKALLKVRTDEELAERLGMSKQNLANWRRRGAVPARTAERIRRDFHIELAEPPRRTRRAEMTAAHALGLMAVTDYVDSLAREPTLEEWQRLGDSYIFLLEAIRGFIARELPRDRPNTELISEAAARKRAANLAFLAHMMSDDMQLPPEFPS
jgi:transcriptional regulator with XRE-family HTH domain